MHELALIRNVVDIVISKCHDMGAVRASKVQIIVGEARDVVDEFATDLYERLTRNTVAEGSRLEIIRTPITVRCKQCGFVFPVDIHREETLVCPSCKAERDYRLCSGMEFMVRSIEIAELRNEDADIQPATQLAG